MRDLLVTCMEKLKELALCRPGDEKTQGRYDCWHQLPEWIHVFLPCLSLVHGERVKTAVTNCTKRNSN